MICKCLQLNLGIFTITRPNFNYFSHFHNYDVNIGNFILLVGWILGLFSSINNLICPINCNSHQISFILKVFYSDIGVYFYVCIIFLFMIYIYLFVYIKYAYVCVFLFKFKKLICSKIDISILNIVIWNWHLNSKLLFWNLKFIF